MLFRSSSDAAWQVLLGRAPIALNWTEVDTRTGMDYLSGFDFGIGARAFRQWLLKGKDQFDFKIRLS